MLNRSKSQPDCTSWDSLSRSESTTKAGAAGFHRPTRQGLRYICPLTRLEDRGKQRALICADIGDFTHAVAACAELAEHLTKRAMSSDQALRGFKAAMDARWPGLASADQVD
jgi:hypothetical protein